VGTALIPQPSILSGPPSERGWYAAYIDYIDDGQILPAFWDGQAWSKEKESPIYRVLWVYDKLFQSEKEADDWISC
jgi:hypothetical protein